MPYIAKMTPMAGEFGIVVSGPRQAGVKKRRRHMKRSMKRTLYLAAIPAAFALGMFASPSLPLAHAQAPAPMPALRPAIIDLTALTNADLGGFVIGTIRSKAVAQTPNGTLSLQTGDAPRHTHAQSDEFQYVISGEGKFWLDGSMRDIHPGELIVIPRGTVHGGSSASSGQFRVLALKMPPPVAGDTQIVK
jgi:mannose-6-phosphate isomerase-like protein (cupin superfamily)